MISFSLRCWLQMLRPLSLFLRHLDQRCRWRWRHMPLHRAQYRTRANLCHQVNLHRGVHPIWGKGQVQRWCDWQPEARDSLMSRRHIWAQRVSSRLRQRRWQSSRQHELSKEKKLWVFWHQSRGHQLRAQRRRFCQIFSPFGR